MFTQKLYRNGNSVAVTIPKQLLEQLNLKEGSEVWLEKTTDSNALVISDKKKTKEAKTRISITPEFMKWLEGFNKQYGAALKELAKR